MKFDALDELLPKKLSRPARGAWVEILSLSSQRCLAAVAPRKGRVG